MKRNLGKEVLQTPRNVIFIIAPICVTKKMHGLKTNEKLCGKHVLLSTVF